MRGKGLGVNMIALRAGVDKKMIYWNFERYNNLVKTYIENLDFGLLFFVILNSIYTMFHFRACGCSLIYGG